MLDLAKQADAHTQQHYLFWYFKGSAQLQLKQFADAAKSLYQAKTLNPQQPQIRIRRVDACLHGALFEEAYSELAEIETRFSQLLAKDWFRLGVLQHQLNLEKKALTSFENAVNLEPDNIEFIYNLALSQKNYGMLKQAAQNLTNVVVKQPGHVDAWHALTLLQKAIPEKNAVAQLSSLLSDTAPQQQIKLQFSLAKSYEDLGDFDTAFACMHQANRARKQRMAYRVKDDIKLMQELKKNHHGRQTSVSALNSMRPIFIVGLPRSGSTLVERILTQPDNVGSAGELLHFSALLSRLTTAQFGAATNRAEFLCHTTQICPEKLGKAYLIATDALAYNTAFLVDKMPLNFLNVGAILRALPRARIIHMQRRPIANVLAIYKTLFEQAYPYAYDLDDIARYLVAERDLMNHWKSLFPEQITSCRYESFVTEPEKSGKTLFEFCSLEFHPDFLDLSRNQSAAATASATQVRQGIYSSSLDNWRNYEQYLQPAIKILQGSGLF